MCENYPTKQDLRVQRSKKALTAALFTLLDTTAFGKITVNDLCGEAMVSRATFYAHFEDKYHLLRFALEEVRDGLGTACYGDQKALITHTLNHLSDNARRFRNLFGDDNQELRQMLSGLFVQTFTANLEHRAAQGQSLPAPPKLLAVFIAGGISSLLLGWVSGGLTLPKEEMAAHLYALSCRMEQGTCS